MSNYTPFTKEQKIAYAKQFTKEERESYRCGKKNGFLEGIHKPKKYSGGNFTQRTYAKEDFDKLFETLGEVKI